MYCVWVWVCVSVCVSVCAYKCMCSCCLMPYMDRRRTGPPPSPPPPDHAPEHDADQGPAVASTALPLERALSAEEPFMEDVEVPAWVDDELDDGDGDPLLSPGPQHASDPLSPHPREPAAVVSVVSPAAAFGRASSVASTHNVPAPLSDPLTSTTYVQCLSFAL